MSGERCEGLRGRRCRRLFGSVPGGVGSPRGEVPLSLPLLAELQRRRVFRVLIGYGIVAFAVLQIVEPIMHALRLPDATLTYVVVALALGFPVAVVLAWAFDVNEGRIERTGPAVSQNLRGPRLPLVLVGIGLLAAAPGVAWYFVFPSHLKPAAKLTGSAQATPSIAVLPFADMSPGKDQEYFSDGIAEEILNALAQIQGLRVIGRTSSFSFKGKTDDLRSIGEKLGVSTVLEGSVRKAGARLRITTQLIETAGGSHLWSQTYDRDQTDVFAVQDEIARAIVQALKPRLVHGPALVQQATASSGAHDLYLQGRYFWNQRSREGLTKGAALFEQALVLDPNYALAHSGLADCYNFSIDYGQARAAEVLPKARAHALKAVQLDDALAEGHASLGLLGMDDYEWGTAERELKRAIELRPGYATAHHWYALVLGWTGRLAEARAEAEQARNLEPTSLIINNLVAIMLFDSRDNEGAIAQGIKTLELNPAVDQPRIWLAMAYQQAGRFAEALATLDKAPAHSDWSQSHRAWVLAASGQWAAARQVLADVEKRFATAPFPRGPLAGAHFALGDMDGGFEWLDRAVEERDQTVFSLKISPEWDPIRADPRYHTLLKRMNLE